MYRRLDLIVTTLAIVSLFIAIYGFEADLGHFQQQLSNNENVQIKQTTPAREVTLYINIITIMINVARHYFLLKWQQLSRNNRLQSKSKALRKRIGITLQPSYPQQNQSKFASFTFFKQRWLFLDTLILIIAPFPVPNGGFDQSFNQQCLDRDDAKKTVRIEYPVSTVLLAITFVRVVFIIKTAIIHSQINRQKFICPIRNSSSKKIKSRAWLSLQFFISQRPLQFFITFYTASVLIFAYLLRIFEAPYLLRTFQSDFNSFFYHIWNTISSMCLFGHGGPFPATPLGKIVNTLTQLTGSALLMLLLGLLFNSNQNELKMMQEHQVRVNACAAIQYAYRHYKAKAILKMPDSSYNKSINSALNKELEDEVKVLRRGMERSVEQFKHQRSEQLRKYGQQPYLKRCVGKQVQNEIAKISLNVDTLNIHQEKEQESIAIINTTLLNLVNLQKLKDDQYQFSHSQLLASLNALLCKVEELALSANKNFQAKYSHSESISAEPLTDTQGRSANLTVRTSKREHKKEKKDMNAFGLMRQSSVANETSHIAPLHSEEVEIDYAKSRIESEEEYGSQIDWKDSEDSEKNIVHGYHNFQRQPLPPLHGIKDNKLNQSVQNEQDLSIIKSRNDQSPLHQQSRGIERSSGQEEEVS
ncbi:hypothetical protein FGO68_gene9813 [Halteria grandinella]|uniref:Potassium channel domain-containing protein n=1 Tax=Halteria grandinella TaxID=5974 RepID=A0A8J8P444_HALGN|nr:hypothetical protein FGO68_gene9813 [Halteria grandinella]